MTNAVIEYKNVQLKKLKERHNNDNTGSMNILYGMYKNEFMIVPEKLYEETDTFERESLKNKVFKFINEGTSVFTNTFRAIHYGDSKDYELRGFGLLRHLCFNNDFNEEYFYQLIYQYYNRNELIIKHTNFNKKLSLEDLNIQSSEVINKYKIAKLPDDIANIIRSKDIKKIEEILKLNTKTGFYEYIDNNGYAIPVMCRHLLMYLKGISLVDISIECLKNGQCRYCGQEMSNYAEHLVSDIPSSVVSIIYQFFDLIPYNFNISQLFYNTAEYLTKTLEKNDILSEKKQQIFTYLFFYSYLLNSTIKFRTSTKKYRQFISDASKVANANGLTINELNDFKLVEDYSIYDNIIQSALYNNTINYYEMIPLSLLFDIDNFNSVDELKASTNEQKLYQALKMPQFNEQVDNFIRALFKMDITKDFISKTFDIPKIPIQEKSGVLLVFLKIIKYFCPVNIIHSFSNGVCKHCGYNSKKENSIETYEKHPLENGTNIPSSIEHFETPNNEIYFNDIKENDLLDVLKNSIFYNQLMENIGKDIEKDTKIIEDIYGYRMKKLTEKDIKLYYIYYAKTHSNDELEYILLYYYHIGIVDSSYSLAIISLERTKNLGDADDIEDED